MAVLIVASKRDTAAQNIARQLIRDKALHLVSGTSNDLYRRDEVFLRYVDTDGIYTDRVEVDANTTVDAVIFASRHRSEAGGPSLTAHWTGNPTSSADLGGNPKSLSFADPPRLRAAFLALVEEREARKLNYAVTLEATHHGPTELRLPTLFVEIGSKEREWGDLEAAGAASEAIWRAATAPAQGIEAVGFGGGHYCNKQSQAMREQGYAFSHILSKYFFENYDHEIVRMAFERTLGDCRTAVIDWKGMRGPDRTRLLDTLKTMNIEIIRV